MGVSPVTDLVTALIEDHERFEELLISACNASA
jgi:hypothetical protein